MATWRASSASIRLIRRSAEAEIAPRPTFCVWELAIVAHEALAWSRFLASDRDEAALSRWREDMLDAEFRRPPALLTVPPAYL